MTPKPFAVSDLEENPNPHLVLSWIFGEEKILIRISSFRGLGREENFDPYLVTLRYGSKFRAFFVCERPFEPFEQLLISKRNPLKTELFVVRDLLAKVSFGQRSQAVI